MQCTLHRFLIELLGLFTFDPRHGSSFNSIKNKYKYDRQFKGSLIDKWFDLLDLAVMLSYL